LTKNFRKVLIEEITSICDNKALFFLKKTKRKSTWTCLLIFFIFEFVCLLPQFYESTNKTRKPKNFLLKSSKINKINVALYHYFIIMFSMYFLKYIVCKFCVYMTIFDANSGTPESSPPLVENISLFSRGGSILGTSLFKKQSNCFENKKKFWKK